LNNANQNIRLSFLTYTRRLNSSFASLNPHPNKKAPNLKGWGFSQTINKLTVSYLCAFQQ